MLPYVVDIHSNTIFNTATRKGDSGGGVLGLSKSSNEARKQRRRAYRKLNEAMTTYRGENHTFGDPTANDAIKRIAKLERSCTNGKEAYNS